MLSLYSSEIARRSTWTCLSCSAAALGPSFVGRPQTRKSPQVHQRKHSSSKTSSATKYDARALATASKTPTEERDSTTPVDVEQTSSPRSRKRRVKEAAQESAQKGGDISRLNLPSVPSTEEIHPLDIHLATFFSQHRPLSVSHAIPPFTATESSSDLFRPSQPFRPKHEEVIQTLSSAVDTLDLAVSLHEEQSTPEEVDLKTAVAQASSSSNTPSHDASHTVSRSNPTQIDTQELARNFRPFMPPPPPVPLAAMKEAAQNTAKAQRRQTNKSAWTSQMTVLVNVQPNGTHSFKTHMSPLTQIQFPTSKPAPAQKYEEPQQQPRQQLPPSPPRAQSFLGRMLERQIAYEDREDRRFQYKRPIMQTLSVRRQRKLKMKKHKYKKLTKRMRTLKKKLGR